MFHRWFRIIFIFVGIPLALAASLYHLDKRGVFLIDNLDVRFTDQVENSQYFVPLVAQLNLGLRDLKNTKLWDINLENVIKITDGHPWIETVSIHRSWPSTLVVTLTSKKILANILNSDGSFSPLLKNGDLLPSVAASQAPDVPILRGGEFLKSKDLRSRAATALAQIPESGKSFSRSEIAELDYEGREGFVAVMMSSKIKVNLGSDDIATKADRVAQVLDYLENRHIEARVIDANLSKKVLVRPRKDP